MTRQPPINIPLVSLSIVRKQYANACLQAEKDLPRYLPRVENFLPGQMAEGGLIHDCSRFKLLELAFLLERFQPKSILELGGGSTTAVFTEYASRSTQPIRYVSIDESDHYQELTRAKLSPDLEPYVDFKVCKKVVRSNEDTPECHYATDYFEWFNKGVDFLYIDGPENGYGDDQYMACIDNVLLIKQGIVPKVIAYDLRRDSIWAFEKEPEFLWYDIRRWHGSMREQDLVWFVDKPFHHSLQTLRTDQVRLYP